LSILNKLTAGSERSTDIGLLVMRLWFGLVMAFTHGLGKMTHLSGFSASVAKLGLPAPSVMAFAAAASELAGGLLLALGLFTRVAGPALASTMLVAAFVVHSDDPFIKKEFALAYAVVAIVLTITGAGRLSLDGLLFNRQKPNP